MGLNGASISKAAFQAVISQSCLAPFTDSMQIAYPIGFNNVRNLTKFFGTYTPNDDYRYLVQGATLDTSPNFMIVMADKQINFTMSSSHFGNQIIAGLAVIKFGFFSWLTDPDNFIQGIFIEGRVARDSKMPQGVPVNYTIIAGTADIT